MDRLAEKLLSAARSASRVLAFCQRICISPIYPYLWAAVNACTRNRGAPPGFFVSGVAALAGHIDHSARGGEKASGPSRPMNFQRARRIALGSAARVQACREPLIKSDCRRKKARRADERAARSIPPLSRLSRRVQAKEILA